MTEGQLAELDQIDGDLLRAIEQAEHDEGVQLPELRSVRERLRSLYWRVWEGRT